MEMEKDASAGGGTFRVSVSLAHYFADERARCYMAADGSRPVSWLARRLRRTFALPERVALSCAGHLLPPAEPLSLLRPEDVLEVIPANCKVVDVSRQAKPPPPLPLPADEPPVPPSPPSLQEVKRRALALVALHEERAQETLACNPGREESLLRAEGEGAPHTVRRRRRVRRRRALAELEPEPELKYEKAERAEVGQDAAATVVRNESVARAPRQVQALPPLQPPPPPLPLSLSASALASPPFVAGTVPGGEVTRDPLTMA